MKIHILLIFTLYLFIIGKVERTEKQKKKQKYFYHHRQNYPSHENAQGSKNKR